MQQSRLKEELATEAQLYFIYDPICANFKTKRSNCFLLGLAFLRRLYLLFFISGALFTSFSSYPLILNYMLVFPLIGRDNVASSIAGSILSVLSVFMLNLLASKKPVFGAVANFYTHFWYNVLNLFQVGLLLHQLKLTFQQSGPELALSAVLLLSLLLVLFSSLTYQFFYFSFAFNSEDMASKYPYLLYIVFFVLEHATILLYQLFPEGALRNLGTLLIYASCSSLELINCFQRFPYFERDMSKAWCVFCSMSLTVTVDLLALEVLNIELLRDNIIVFVGFTTTFVVGVMLNLRNRVVKDLLIDSLENIHSDYHADLKIRLFYSLFRNSHVKKNELYLASFLKMHCDLCADPACVCRDRDKLYDPKSKSGGSSALQPHKDYVFVKHYFSKFIKEAAEKFKDSKLIALDSLYYHFESMRLYAKTYLGLHHFAESPQLSRHEKYCAYVLLEQCQQYLVERNERLSKGGVLDIEKAKQFEQSLQSIVDLVKRASRCYLQFWQQLGTKLEYKPIRIKAYQLLELTRKIEKQYADAIKLNRDNRVLHYVMQIYSRDLAFDEALMLKVSKNFVLEAGTSEINNSNVKSLRFNKFSEQSVCLLVSCQAESLGQILECSKNTQKNLGFAEHQLLGAKINAVMPTIFQRCHDNIMSHWIESGREDSLGKLNPTWCSNRAGFLSSAVVVKKVIPLSDSLQLLGVIHREASVECVLCEQDGTISAVSEKAFQRLFKGSELNQVVGQASIFLFAPKLCFFFIDYFNEFQQAEGKKKDFPYKTCFGFYLYRNLPVVCSKLRTLFIEERKLMQSHVEGFSDDPMLQLESLRNTLEWLPEGMVCGEMTIRGEIAMHQLYDGERFRRYYSIIIQGSESSSSEAFIDPETPTRISRYIQSIRYKRTQFLKKEGRKRPQLYLAPLPQPGPLKEDRKQQQAEKQQQNEMDQTEHNFTRTMSRRSRSVPKAKQPSLLPLLREQEPEGNIKRGRMVKFQFGDQVDEEEVVLLESKSVLEGKGEARGREVEDMQKPYKQKKVKRVELIAQLEGQMEQGYGEQSKLQLEQENVSSVTEEQARSLDVVKSFKESVFSSNESSVTNSKIRVIREEIKQFNPPSENLLAWGCLALVVAVVAAMLIAELLVFSQGLSLSQLYHNHSSNCNSQLLFNFYLCSSLALQDRKALGELNLGAAWLEQERRRFALYRALDNRVYDYEYKLSSLSSYLSANSSLGSFVVPYPFFYEFIPMLSSIEQIILKRQNESAPSLDSRRKFYQALPVLQDLASLAFLRLQQSEAQNLAGMSQWISGLNGGAIGTLTLGLALFVLIVRHFKQKSISAVELFRLLNTDSIDRYQEHFRQLYVYMQKFEQNINKQILQSQEQRPRLPATSRMRQFSGLEFSLSFVIKPAVVVLCLLVGVVALKFYLEVRTVDTMQKTLAATSLLYNSTSQFYSKLSGFFVAKSKPLGSAQMVVALQNMEQMFQVTENLKSFHLCSSLGIKSDDLLQSDCAERMQSNPMYETLRLAKKTDLMLQQTSNKLARGVLYEQIVPETTDSLADSFYLVSYVNQVKRIVNANLQEERDAGVLYQVVITVVLVSLAAAGGLFLGLFVLKKVEDDSVKANAFILLIPFKLIEENQYLKAFIKNSLSLSNNV